MTDKELMKLFKEDTRCRFIGKFDFDNVNGGYIKVKIWEVHTTTNGYQSFHISNAFTKGDAENIKSALERNDIERGGRKFAVTIEKGMHHISRDYMNDFLGIKE